MSEQQSKKDSFNFKEDYNERFNIDDESIADKRKAIKIFGRKIVLFRSAIIFITIVFLVITLIAGIYIYKLKKNYIGITTEKNEENNKNQSLQSKLENIVNDNDKLTKELSALKTKYNEAIALETSRISTIETLNKELTLTKTKFNEMQNNKNNEIQQLKQRLNIIESENYQLKKELFKEDIEDMKKSMNESDIKNINIFNYTLMCPNDPSNVPLISIREANKQILVDINCSQSNYFETMDINAYIQKVIDYNKDINFYCQKSDASHKHIKAEYFYNGKYFCNECINKIKELVDEADIKHIEPGIFYTGKVNKYYCPVCNKHYDESFKLNEHNLQHNAIELTELNNLLINSKFEDIQNNVDCYLNNDLYAIKESSVYSIKNIISDVIKKLKTYQNKIEAILYLGKIIKYNYSKNINYPNYYIINNMLLFSNLLSHHFNLKNFNIYVTEGLNLDNISRLLKLLDENLIN